MKTLSQICVGFFLFLSLSECSDHRLVGTDQQFRIKTVAIRAARIAVIYSFNYDSMGRLVSFATRNHPDPATPSQLNVLQYDVQGRLVKSEAQPAQNGSGGRRTEYKYDVDGNLVSVITLVDDDLSGSYILQDEVILTYDGTGKVPVRISDSKQVTILTYEASNVTQVISIYTGSNPAVPDTDTASYAYDERPNPLYNLSAALINTSIGGLRLLSKNNVTNTDFILTYNANGLLMKRSNAGFNLFYEETYEYEAY